MKKLISSLLGLILMALSLSANAQSDVPMADGLRSEGKIYVVVAIILIVLTGLFVYLFLMDRKVKKLEDLLADKNHSTK